MEQLERQIYDILEKPMRIDALAHQLPGTSRRAITEALETLEKEGKILRNKKNNYAHITHFGCLTGIYQATGRAFAFVTPDEGEGDIFLPPRASGGAWQGDHVLVRLTDTAVRGTEKREGAVLRILSRAEREITGTLLQHGRALYVQPDSTRYPEIEIAKRKTGGAVTGQKVAVKIVFYGDPSRRLPPQGVVNAILGESGTMESSIASILYSNGIAGNFPEDALQQAQSLPQTVPDDAIAGRLDFREHMVFTIDGDDAKDFDDAISIEPLPNGHLSLGVHIADVTQYVTPGSPLDAEAWQRGTSVYYPAHVVPMLPVALSNGICSLNPDVERLTFSAILELDTDGKRHGVSFSKSVIRSKARMTYNNVNKILDGDESICAQYDDRLLADIRTIAQLTAALTRRRLSRGALELDIPEAEIYTDDTGKPVDIQARPRGRAERLIEECMLLANEAVAEYMVKHAFPAVYRVHENPDPEKLRVFAQFARQFGYRIDSSKPENTAQLQAVLNGAKKDPMQSALPTLLLRSLARARYAPDCIGHYGLQAKYYLHFTSPIRRYPDLAVHRMLAKSLAGTQQSAADLTFCEEAAAQATERELAADTAERDIDKLYMAAYMKPLVGQAFDGRVSSVTNFGMFIMLPNTVEGLIRLETLESDTFVYDADHMALVGQRTGHHYQIGTPVRVLLTAASEITGQIDFVLQDSAHPTKRKD